MKSAARAAVQEKKRPRDVVQERQQTGSSIRDSNLYFLSLFSHKHQPRWKIPKLRPPLLLFGDNDLIPRISPRSEGAQPIL